MADTAGNVIDSVKYDIWDDNDLLSPEKLLDFLKRAIRQLDAILAALKSDWVHASTTATISSGDNYTAVPSLCLNVIECWISTTPLEKKSVDYIYSRRQSLGSSTAKPVYWAQAGANIIVDYTTDADYELTVMYNKKTDLSSFTRASSMPYGDEFNDVLRQAVALIADNLRQNVTPVDGALYDFFWKACSSKVIGRIHVPQRYYLDF